MSDPAIKLFGKTIPLPELVVGDLTTEQQDQNPVRLSDSCNGDDEEMCDSGLAGGGGDGGGGDSESQKVKFWICKSILKSTHDLFHGNDR
ncbi:hypothetical protein Bca52824_027355 [Brassica carinata]|uniref:Uncharacterized protein n=1 Tax=Brassica carinata TaxID=52824 RepID=A0A8X7V9Q3_BRACI|nr:hypothetical protein Bca52824_027355 [Brassica carinata]